MLFHDFPVSLIIIVPGFSMMVNAFDERQIDRQTENPLMILKFHLITTFQLQSCDTSLIILETPGNEP